MNPFYAFLIETVAAFGLGAIVGVVTLFALANCYVAAIHEERQRDWFQQ